MKTFTSVLGFVLLILGVLNMFSGNSAEAGMNFALSALMACHVNRIEIEEMKNGQ
jgi:uncharacterized membrane protein